MATKQFDFRPGFKVFNRVDPQIAGEELDRILDRDGKVTPGVLVAESRPKDAPLHPAFEWHDQAAAEQWRLHQARNIIKAIVEITEIGAEQFIVALAATKEEPRSYRRVGDVALEPDEVLRALEVLTTKLAGAEKALQDFQRVIGQRGEPAVALVALAASSLAAARDAISRIH